MNDFIGPHKTFEQCKAKMNTLRGKNDSYDKLVDHLKKKLNVKEEWVQEKKKESNCFPIEHYDNEIISLRES